MNILRNPFLRPYVAGADFKRNGAAALDAFGTIAGGISDLMVQRLNDSTVQKTNRMNYNIAEANNEAAMNIARENNAFQERMNRENNQFAHDEAIAAFQRQADWNNPSNQAKMLESAGINPSVYFGGGSAVGSASSAPAQAHGSGVSSSMPVLSTPQMEAFQYSNPSQSIKNMADAAAALAGAKKQGVETDTLEKTQQDIMRRMKAEGDLSELQSYFEKKFGDSHRSRQLKEMDANTAKATEEAYLLAKEGKFTEARTRLTDAQEATEKEMRSLRHAEAEQARKDNEFAYELINAKISNLESQTTFNRAGAYNQSAQARFTESQNQELQQMMQYNLQIKQNAAQMSQAEVMKQGAVLYEEINYLLSHYENLSESEKYQLEQVKYAAKMAQFKYDMRWCDYAMDTIERVNNGANKWAPWALSRTDNVVRTNDTLYDGSTMQTETRSTGYKAPWHK